jgi:hypothetical protein
MALSRSSGEQWIRGKALLDRAIQILNVVPTWSNRSTSPYRSEGPRAQRRPRISGLLPTHRSGWRAVRTCRDVAAADDFPEARTGSSPGWLGP